MIFPSISIPPHRPLALLLLTGLAFAMLGVALERILNPRLLEK